VSAAEGPQGILSGLSKDKVWIDHSTTDHNNTKVTTGLRLIQFDPIWFQIMPFEELSDKRIWSENGAIGQ